MDKTRISDIYRFLESKGYSILHNYGQTQSGNVIAFEVANWANKGMVGCCVTTTKFVMSTDMYLIKAQETFDFSDEWLEFMIKEHPDMVPQMLKEMEERIIIFETESNTELERLKEEYKRVYNESRAERKKLQRTRDKIANIIKSSDNDEAGLE